MATSFSSYDIQIGENTEQYFIVSPCLLFLGGVICLMFQTWERHCLVVKCDLQ